MDPPEAGADTKQTPSEQLNGKIWALNWTEYSPGHVATLSIFVTYLCHMHEPVTRANLDLDG